jgi:uncharacterized membrane protein
MTQVWMYGFMATYIFTLIKPESTRNQSKVGKLMTFVLILGLLVVVANLAMGYYAVCQDGLHTAALVGTIVILVGTLTTIVAALIIVRKCGDTYSGGKDVNAYDENQDYGSEYGDEGEEGEEGDEGKEGEDNEKSKGDDYGNESKIHDNSC